MIFSVQIIEEPMQSGTASSKSALSSSQGKCSFRDHSAIMVKEDRKMHLLRWKAIISFLLEFRMLQSLKICFDP